MATNVAGGSTAMILSRSKPLRLFTLLLFYFTQGFPIGLFYYALPAWMSANGASTAEIASVVAASALPWSFKLINGFLIDRYTFLPMGRRRSWIIGAQALIVAIFLAGAIISPASADIFLLSALGFCANTAVTFQDVGIDSLAVDIMPDNERAKAAGIMFGSQLLGVSAATALGGFMFQNWGLTVGLIGLSMIPFLVMIYGICIRERSGERLLPWTSGISHPLNAKIKVDAWWPLLRGSFKALYVPLTLAIIPILLLRSVPYGAFETFHPELFTQTAGWQISEYTNLISTSTLISGVLGLIFGGWLIDTIGSRKGLMIGAGGGAIMLIAMGFAQPLWTQGWLLVSFTIVVDIFALLYIIAVIPICMRLCSPVVAATQFTIYMAVGNFGRPIGAWLAAETAGNGYPQWLYWCGAIGWVSVMLIMLAVRFPRRGEAVEEIIHEQPQAEGIPAKVD